MVTVCTNNKQCSNMEFTRIGVSVTLPGRVVLMSLADSIAAIVPPPVLCKTALWLEKQSPEDARAFAGFLADGGRASDLHRLCVKNGLSVGETTFRAHCHGRCCCARTSVAA